MRSCTKDIFLLYKRKQCSVQNNSFFCTRHYKVFLLFFSLFVCLFPGVVMFFVYFNTYSFLFATKLLIKF